MNFIENAIGRKIPESINGVALKPFRGAFHTPPSGRRYAKKIKSIRPGEEKLLGSIEEAIKRTGLKDGMTISFHHHFRNGDKVANMVVDAIANMGIKNITLAPSSMFPVHDRILEHIKSGVVSHIEGGSVRSEIGKAVSRGLLPDPVRVRTHGGRTRAVEAGELRIDVAFLGTPTADPQGNANGVHGASACGPLGFAINDALYADNVVVITDNLVEYPATPISIPQSNVDYVVEVDSIGNPEKILDESTNPTTNPSLLEMAENVARVLDQLGYIKDGFSFQAGAGAISLSAVQFLNEMMMDRKAVASFAMGGISGQVVDMLHQGNLKKILNAQAFDLKAVKSLLEDDDHIEVSHYLFGNPHSRGCIVNQQDTCFLGATEMDVDFNINVNTFSNGYLLKPSGGHPDAAAGSRVTIAIAPLVRKVFPVVREAVTSVTTPGETVDVIITDHGIAANPRSRELYKALMASDLPMVDIHDLQKEAYARSEGPPQVKFGDKVIGLIEYRDGTIIDTVRNVVVEE